MFPRLSVFVALLCSAVSPVFAASGRAPLTVDPSFREESRQFYRAVYGVSDDIPIAWTGTLSGTPTVNVTGTAGTTSTAFKEGVLLRVNWFRAMAGLSANLIPSDTFAAKAQLGALMITANQSLLHNPPTTALLYTADGAEATGFGNLSIGRYGPDAITFGYMCDAKANNFNVGHRRLLLYPQTQTIGTGDIPPTGSFFSANCLYVVDSNYFGPRPTTRNPYVAWPAPGFSPYQVVFTRWSFAIPDADFSAATVTMTRGGTPITVRLETLETVTGENTLVWSVPDPVTNTIDTTVVGSFPRPTVDTTYNVTVSGVRIAGQTRNFTYAVTVFDPDVATSGSSPTSITTPATTTVGQSNTFRVTTPSFSSNMQWRTLETSTYTTVYGAEGGLGGVIPFTTGSYNPAITSPVGAGSGAFHLVAPTRDTQSLRLPDTFYLQSGATGTLTYLSRLGFATSGQIARVQISLDEGASWTDLTTQAGVSDTVANPGETAYTTRTVSLAAYAGRTFNLRFAYTAPTNDTTPAYTDVTTAPAVGWFIDNITVTGAQKVTPGVLTSGVANNFFITPTFAGTTLLQARGVMFGLYPLEWSPVTSVLATNSDGSNASSRLSNLSVRTSMAAGQTLIVGAVTTGPKSILVRGVGPTLAGFGVTTAMPDPRLELYNGSGAFVSSNAGWNNDATLSAAFASVAAFPLNAGSKDAALVRPIDGGSSIQVKTDRGGIALVELYDTGSALSARLTNASTRNLVGTGDNILILGFYISGTGTKRLLIRAAGPKLASFGVTGTLADPRLDLFSSDNSVTPLASNDNWTPDLKPIMQSVAPGFPFDDGSKDAALVVTLPSERLYNILVKGADGGTGEAIVEIYELP